MNMIKRITAVCLAVILLATTAFAANAAELDEAERRYLTDKLFEYVWLDGLHNDYYKITQSTVTIEHNPLAAMEYFTIEAEVFVCDKDLLQELSDGKIDVGDFFKKNEFNYEEAKKKSNKYKNSLIFGYEFGLTEMHECYNYGTWEFRDTDYNNFYGYFKEDDENFTLYEEGTDKVLGVYKKLIGYEYLDDSNSGTSGNGGSSGGNGGNGGSGSSSDGSSNNGSGGSNGDVDTSVNTSVFPNGSSSDNTNNNYSDNSDASGNYNYSTGIIDDDTTINNPAVTPEIVSMVDSMKDRNSDFEDQPVGADVYEPLQPMESNSTGIIIAIAVIAIVVMVFVIFSKKKGEKNAKN